MKTERYQREQKKNQKNGKTQKVPILQNEIHPWCFLFTGVLKESNGRGETLEAGGLEDIVVMLRVITCVHGPIVYDSLSYIVLYTRHPS